LSDKFPQIGILAKPVKHQVAATGHIERALTRAGYRVRVSYDFTAPEKVVFCWGWGKAKEVRAVNPDAIICCIDHGYTANRKQFINTGWSIPSMRFGLNGFAEHPWIDDRGARLRAMGWDREIIQPRDRWMSVPTGVLGRALVLGQVYGDAMIVDHVEDYGAWLRSLIDQLNRDGWETLFRPHPIMVARGTVDRYGNLGRMSHGEALEDDLARVNMVAAMNSNGLVTAFQHGLEVRAWNKGTMLGPLMTGPGDPIPFKHRTELLARLAWCQWTYPELENGDWLRIHAPIMHRLVDGGPAYPWHDRRIET
jgi:hypothetical protein